MTRKVYITLGNRARLNIPITIGERTIRIEFSNGGLASAGNGRYMTCDEKIQKALEALPDFGKAYRLQDTIRIDEPQVAKAAPKAKAEKEEEVVEQQQQQEQEQDDDVLSFANFNELRDYLINEYGSAASAVRSLTLALGEAKKLGLNVEISK